MKTPDEFPVEIKRGNAVLKIYRTQNKGYTEYRLAYYAQEAGKLRRKMETFSAYAKARARADIVKAVINAGDMDELRLSKTDAVIYQRATDALQGVNNSLPPSWIGSAKRSTRTRKRSPRGWCPIIWRDCRSVNAPGAIIGTFSDSSTVG
jgi:hypothetical protein